MGKIAIYFFVFITGVAAIPNPQITPSSPAEIVVNSQQRFTCSITLEQNWRDVTISFESVSALFYNASGCNLFELSTEENKLYQIRCGVVLGQFLFTIKNVTETNHGKIIECKARYGTGGETDTFVMNSTMIHVIIPLTHVNISPNTSPLDVERATIRRFICDATSRPFTDIVWKIAREGQNIQNLTSLGEQKEKTTTKSWMNYTGNKADNGADIYCTGQYNGMPIDSKKIRLRIIYMPDTELRIHQVPAKNITTGDDVTLKCTVSGGNPLPVLSWNCTGITANQTKENETSNSVSFTVNKTYDNRVCTCFVLYHPVLSYRPSKNLLLVVFYPPDKDPLIQQTPPTYILAGNNVTLTCTVSGGNPLAVLAWNCNGTNVHNTIGKNVSYSITFTVNKKYNNKICTCSATHFVPSYKPNVNHTLVVYYAPEKDPSIQKIPYKNLTVGDYVTLTCIVIGGNPLATLSWNCTGTTSTNTSGNTASYSVAFTVNRLYNNMVCTCSALHSVGSYKPNVHHHLIVYFSPGEPMIKPIPTMPWFEGNSTSLLCKYEEGNPKAYIRWTSGNKSEGASNDNPIFVFDRIERDYNTKEITCTVYNSYSINLSTKIHLDVQYEPDIWVEEIYILTSESKNISLSCYATGNPVPFVQWVMTKKELNLPTTEKSILYIENINRTDSGNYTCEANSSSTSYGNLVSRKETQVVVNFAPDVTVIRNALNITELTNLTLTCNATGQPSKYTYRWKHMFAGNTIRVFNSNSKTLLLTNLSYQDIGKYECYVNNGIEDRYGKLNQTNNTIVDVQFRPAFVRYDKVTTGKAGSNVSVSIDIISFPDIDNAVKWRNSTENSILVNNSNIFMTMERKCVHTKIYNISVPFYKYGYTSSLHFPKFDDNQDGFYNLEVSNIIGINKKTVRLVFSDRPDPPTLFSASIVRSTVVTLTWREGFNGGNNQTFIITYWKMNSIFKKSVNISDRSDKKYEVEISNLIPSTAYIFHIVAKNEEGYSDSANNTLVLPTKDLLEPESSVIGPVAAAVGGIVATGLFVVGILVFRRKSLASRKKTDRKTLTFVSPDEDNEDGLKDNELYVSAGENFTENSTATGDVYAEIRKPIDKKSKDAYIQETVLYADVKRMKDEPKTGKVTKNVRTKQTGKHTTTGKLKKENGRNDDVYENITDQNTKHTPRNLNKDGLVYADLVFKEDGQRKFIIRGIENKTDYADIDLDLKADPLPSDESDEEKDENTENGDLNVEK